ncbi:MAG: MFS transporter [Xanthobacteraceae bacterium]|nr:MFS transporter [Xanthobacteraceae bacterium]
MDAPRHPKRAGANRAKTAMSSARSASGLDWFVFFLADIQTGFGPFIAVYLTASKWSQSDIGLLLTVGSLIALFGQIPAGALLDAIATPLRVAAIAVAVIGVSALIFALAPTYLGAYTSRVMQAGASCLLGPAIAAISLGLVARSKVAERLGRNASFASVGTAIAAAGMGLCGYYISNQAVFFVTAAFALPALAALFFISPSDIDPQRAHGGNKKSFVSVRDVVEFALQHKAVFIFALCVFLFHLANAAVLPIVAGNLTQRSSSTATIFIAAAMLVPQFIVAVISPWVGRMSQRHGRKSFLLAGFIALAIRIVLTSYVTDPVMIVVIQSIDGISAAIIGVLVPVTVSDLTQGTGRFNTVQGFIGSSMGIGASISTTLGGFLADRYTTSTSLMMLAAVAALAAIVVWLLMPETLQDDNA